MLGSERIATASLWGQMSALSHRRAARSGQLPGPPPTWELSPGAAGHSALAVVRSCRHTRYGRWAAVAMGRGRDLAGCRVDRMAAVVATMVGVTAVAYAPASAQQPVVLPTIEVIGNAPLQGSEIDRNKIPANVQTLGPTDFDH